jgi:hypothetical protein
VEPLDVVYSFFLVLHFVGLAAIVGPFLLQLRWKSGHAFPLILGGAITQLVTGLVLIGVATASDVEFDQVKYGVKLILTVLMSAAALVGFLKQRQDSDGGGRELLPFFYAAGGLSLVTTALSVFW